MKDTDMKDIEKDDNGGNDAAIDDNGSRPQDELRASPIVMVGVISAILLFAIIVGTSGAFLMWERDEADRKTSPLMPDDLRRLRSQQMGEINAYRWISEKDGVVRIPVDRAMELVAREEARKSGR